MSAIPYLFRSAIAVNLVVLACLAMNSCSILRSPKEDKEFAQQEILRCTKNIDTWTKELSSTSHHDDYVRAIADAYCDRGLYYEYVGEHEKGREDLKKAVSLLERLPITYHNCYGTVQKTHLPQIYQRLGQDRKALDYYTELCNHPQPEVDQGWGSISWLFSDRAKVYVKLGEYQKAIDDYSAVIRIDPKDYRALNARAKVYADLGNYQQVVDDCSKALTAIEGAKEKNENLQRTFAGSKCSKEMSAHFNKQDYKNYIQPEEAKSYYYRGVAHEKLGKQDLASNDKEKAKEHGYKPESE